MDIFVCVGSSCHLKGSKPVIDRLNALINENGMTGKVVLKGSFCMGQCSHDGVSVKINDVVYSVKENETEDFFKKNILPNA